jgi:hypothetical protein
MPFISGTHDVKENGCHHPQVEREEAELAVVDQFSVLTIFRTLLVPETKNGVQNKRLLAYIRFV